jgi:hypothetical protein
MFIGKLFEHRPSYHLLGVLLFIQLGITSASWAIRNLASLSGNASKSSEAEASSSTTRQKERKAVVLEVGLLAVCYTRACVLHCYDGVWL